LPGAFQALVQRLLEHLKARDCQVAEIEDQITAWHRQNDDSRKLAQFGHRAALLHKSNEG